MIVILILLLQLQTTSQINNSDNNCDINNKNNNNNRNGNNKTAQNDDVKLEYARQLTDYKKTACRVLSVLASYALLLRTSLSPPQGR